MSSRKRRSRESQDGSKKVRKTESADIEIQNAAVISTEGDVDIPTSVVCSMSSVKVESVVATSPQLLPLAVISASLRDQLAVLKFSRPVTHTYNPLEYAFDNHLSFLEKYGQGPKEVLLLGMNPGPFGMAQTGVPFGDKGWVRDFLGIFGPVKKPLKEHPKRPVDGFDCRRSEVSGHRVWSWVQKAFGTAEQFFARFYIHNYCPLMFMESPTGKNRTPDKLSPKERDKLFAICDESLREVVALMKPKYVVGIGKFARGRAEIALAEVDHGAVVLDILHPSPANPLANKAWDETVTNQLKKAGIII